MDEKGRRRVQDQETGGGGEKVGPAETASWNEL